MRDRTIQLVEAALNVFMRYGVSKTTMNDIAKEAGVARQTLYNTYPSKEEVLRATVRHVLEQTVDDVRAAWKDTLTFAGKLDIFFAMGPLNWYDLAHGSAEGAELFDGIHAVANEELRQSALQWNGIFADLVRDATQPAARAHADAADIGAYIYAMALNAKYNADDRATLVTRLDILKRSVIAIVNPAP